jgi:hypothetical protein
MDSSVQGAADAMGVCGPSGDGAELPACSGWTTASTLSSRPRPLLPLPLRSLPSLQYPPEQEAVHQVCRSAPGVAARQRVDAAAQQDEGQRQGSQQHQPQPGHRGPVGVRRAQSYMASECPSAHLLGVDWMWAWASGQGGVQPEHVGVSGHGWAGGQLHELRGNLQ